MREILFRGQQGCDNEWVYGDLYRPNQPHTHLCIRTANGDSYNVIPETVGQYIGVTDNNGVKIFEGDIVLYCYDSGTELHEVIFDKETCSFTLNKGDLYCCIGEFNINRLRVIGNIYDNEILWQNIKQNFIVKE